MPAYLVSKIILGRMVHLTMLPAAVFLLVTLAIFDGFLKASYARVMWLSENHCVHFLKNLKLPREKIGKRTRRQEQRKERVRERRKEREKKKEKKRDRKCKDKHKVYFDDLFSSFNHKT